MVQMIKLDENTWGYTVLDPNTNPPEVLLSGRVLSSSDEECIKNISRAFRVMGECIKHHETSVSVEVLDVEKNELVYADLSPDLVNVDEEGE